MVWGTVSSAETALSHSRYDSLVLSIGCGVRFCCEGEQTGRTVNIRGVGLSWKGERRGSTGTNRGGRPGESWLWW